MPAVQLCTFARGNDFAARIEQELITGAKYGPELFLVVVALFPVESQADKIFREPAVNLWFGEHPALLEFEARSEDARAIVRPELGVSGFVIDERITHQKKWT